VGGLLEQVTKSGTTEYRHLIHGANGLAAIYTRRTAGTPLNETFYVHSDHLGGPELITNESGAVRVRLSFGAYGERRDSDWDGPVSGSDLTTIGNTTRQGFTGHEHLDAVGLIHMNGRVYDPVVGRFLGVDPILALGLSQDVNSYSYARTHGRKNGEPHASSSEDGSLMLRGTGSNAVQIRLHVQKRGYVTGNSNRRLQRQWPSRSALLLALGSWLSVASGWLRHTPS
jgi:RHS repeat-associated protein